MKTKLIGFVLLILILVLSLVLGFIPLWLSDELPSLLSYLGFSGVIIRRFNVIADSFSVVLITVSLSLIICAIIENFIRITISKSALISGFFFLIAASAIFLGPLFPLTSPSLINVFSILSFISGLISLIIFLAPEKSSNKIKIVSLIFAFFLFVVGLLNNLSEAAHNLALLLTFPKNQAFETRNEWTKNFLTEHKDISDMLKSRVKSMYSKDLDLNGFAFTDKHLHTIYYAWMDGLQFSVGMGNKNGEKIALCRGDKTECLLATGGN